GLGFGRARVPGDHLEPARYPGDALHRVVLAHVELEIFRQLAVVRERLAPSGLVVARDERHAADLELVGRREESHEQRVAEQAGDDRPPVEQRAGETRLLGRDADREPARPRADHREIEHPHVTSMIWSRRVPTLTYRMGA